MAAEGWQRQNSVDESRAFVTGNLHVLSAKPKLCYQQAVNTTGADSPLGRKALGLLQESGGGFIEWLNRPNRSRDAAIMSIVAHSEVNSLAFSPDGTLLAAALKVLLA